MFACTTISPDEGVRRSVLLSELQKPEQHNSSSAAHITNRNHYSSAHPLRVKGKYAPGPSPIIYSFHLSRTFDWLPFRLSGSQRLQFGNERQHRWRSAEQRRSGRSYPSGEYSRSE